MWQIISINKHFIAYYGASLWHNPVWCIGGRRYEIVYPLECQSQQKSSAFSPAVIFYKQLG